MARPFEVKSSFSRQEISPGDRAAGRRALKRVLPRKPAGCYGLRQDVHDGSMWSRGLQRPTLSWPTTKPCGPAVRRIQGVLSPITRLSTFVSYYDYYQPEAYVPSSDTFIEKDASVNDHIEQMRLSATKALLEREDCLVVATVSAIYGLGDPNSYFKMLMHLSRGEIIDQRGFFASWLSCNTRATISTFVAGTYRVRGDVIDIFPADSERLLCASNCLTKKLRISASFDPLTGAVAKNCPALPFSQNHYVDSRETPCWVPSSILRKSSSTRNAVQGDR